MRIIRKIIYAIALLLNIIAALGLIVSAHSGDIPCSQWSAAPLAVMIFPACLLLCAAVFVIDLIWWRRTSLIPLGAMILCWGAIRDFCPMHLPAVALYEKEQAKAFTLMTYNVMQFFNQDETVERFTNEQIDYILDESPDVVCIQEARCLSPLSVNHITQEQLRDLNDMYPYIYIEGEDLALLSKFPAKPLQVSFPNKDHQEGALGAWRLDIHGEMVNLFMVHLRSYKFSKEERNVFREATTVETTDAGFLRTVRYELLPKVKEAATVREDQVKQIVKYINKYGGENVIVCGDFNDTVGCYSLRVLEDECDLHSAYSEVGTGPMITFNANHFFFRIDHILYRGFLKPHSMVRGHLKASDHYPLIATFTTE